MGAGDWSPTTTRPVCRINRDSLSLKGPLNDLQEWRALRDANSRLSGQDKSILRSFQLPSCRKQAIALKTPAKLTVVRGFVTDSLLAGWRVEMLSALKRRAIVGSPYGTELGLICCSTAVMASDWMVGSSPKPASQWTPGSRRNQVSWRLA